MHNFSNQYYMYTRFIVGFILFNLLLVCVVSCRSLFFSRLVIVLSVLRVSTFEYSFAIFELFFYNNDSIQLIIRFQNHVMECCRINVREYRRGSKKKRIIQENYQHRAHKKKKKKTTIFYWTPNLRMQTIT